MSKQLQPVYYKPMIYYAIFIIILVGIRIILSISTLEDQRLMGDRSRSGGSLGYAKQARVRGLAQALITIEDFIAGERFALVLGVNIFHGRGFSPKLKDDANR